MTGKGCAVTAETLAPITPLAAFRDRFAAATTATLSLGETAPLTQLTLRGNARDSAFLDAVRGAAGLVPPIAPNTVARAGERAALWLGPDEWLIVAPAQDAALGGTLRKALAGQASSVIDVSAARAVLCITGPGARGLLACGCPLDLHPRAFGPGRCAQTLLARATILLEQAGDAPVFRLYVRASFAAYLASWLLDAVREPVETAV